MCPIRLPGRERRRVDLPFRRIDALVRALADDRALFRDVPFAFFGHSLGSLIAFELARELCRRGLEPPIRLLVSAHPAPQIPQRNSPIHHLPEQEFIDALIHRYGAIPGPILADRQMLELFLPVLRSDMEMLETYRYVPDAPLACPISALGGVLDSTVASDLLTAWQVQTVDAFRLHMFPGNHFYFQDARPQLLQAICGDLAIPFPVS